MRKAYLVISDVDPHQLGLKAEVVENEEQIEAAYLSAKSVVYITPTHKKSLRKKAVRTLWNHGFGSVIGCYTPLNEQSKASAQPPTLEEGYDELYRITPEFKLVRCPTTLS